MKKHINFLIIIIVLITVAVVLNISDAELNNCSERTKLSDRMDGCRLTISMSPLWTNYNGHSLEGLQNWQLSIYLNRLGIYLTRFSYFGGFFGDTDLTLYFLGALGLSVLFFALIRENKIKRMTRYER